MSIFASAGDDGKRAVMGTVLANEYEGLQLSCNVNVDAIFNAATGYPSNAARIQDPTGDRLALSGVVVGCIAGQGWYVKLSEAPHFTRTNWWTVASGAMRRRRPSDAARIFIHKRRWYR